MKVVYPACFYKEKDGGTEPGYFGDLLGKYGVGTEKVNSQEDIKTNNDKPIIP